MTCGRRPLPPGAHPGGSGWGLTSSGGIVMDWAAEAFFSAVAAPFHRRGGHRGARRRAAPARKTADPAVLVMDELGRHVIRCCPGTSAARTTWRARSRGRPARRAVITTATDLSGVPAIDAWSVRNGCAIENRRRSGTYPPRPRRASGGRMITGRCSRRPFPVTLTLRPRTLVLGAGCRRGASSPRALRRTRWTF